MNTSQLHPQKQLPTIRIHKQKGAGNERSFEVMTGFRLSPHFHPRLSSLAEQEAPEVCLSSLLLCFFDRPDFNPDLAWHTNRLLVVSGSSPSR